MSRGQIHYYLSLYKTVSAVGMQDAPPICLSCNVCEDLLK